MKKFLLPALIAASMTIAAPALADPGGHGGRHHGKADGANGPVMKMFDRLNLTADQKTRLKAIKDRYATATKAQHQSLKTKWKELSTLMKSAGANRDAALAKQREINVIQAQLAESRVNAWFEARAVLTPEQLKQLEAMKPGEGKRHGGWKR